MIYRIAETCDWEAAHKTGHFSSSDLAGEGFIHCSERRQVAAVANARYRGRTDLVLLEIDEMRVGAPVRREQPPGSMDKFPHVYGAIPLDAITRHFAFQPGTDGSFTLPPELNPAPCTPRQRMLAAYEGKFSDAIPVAPEFWYYIPARLLKMRMMDFEREMPHWKALQLTFKHYACEGWGIVAPETPKNAGGVRSTTTEKLLSAESMEVMTTLEAGGQVLTSRSILDAHEPAWLVERYIKDFDRDWQLYARATLLPPQELDWKPVQAALDEVGEDYLLEVYLGLPFIDYAGGQREGGLQQVVLDLYDRESEMRALQDRYIDAISARVRAAFDKTTARSIFIGSSWSSLSLLSPALWRKWDKPVLEAVVRAAHECGGLVHHHFHGKCMGILTELAELGLDCICPFERPPGGDVTDLAKVRRAMEGRTAFNGNVHTVETLIRGTAEDVRREVAEILASFSGSPRLIVGTGDQVGVETSDENIRAMIEAVRSYSG